MPELQHISGNEAINVFERMGFQVVRQRGSHVVLRKDDRGCVIPLHKELAVGTLRNAIKQVAITDADFINGYKNR